MNSWTLWSILALIAWGFYGFFPKVSVQHIKPQSSVVFGAMGNMLISTVVFYLAGFRLETHPKGILFAVLTGFAAAFGSYFYLKAAVNADISIIAPVTAMYPAVTILLAAIFLKEPISWRQAAGLALAAGAIWLMAGGDG